MPVPILDLRSDTLTLPTPDMLQSMTTAKLGDDSRDGDPTVLKLEALAAEKTGKEAGAFMPSGTMTNLVAMLTHAPPPRHHPARADGVDDRADPLPAQPRAGDELPRVPRPDRREAALAAAEPGRRLRACS